MKCDLLRGLRNGFLSLLFNADDFPFVSIENGFDKRGEEL